MQLRHFGGVAGLGFGGGQVGLPLVWWGLKGVDGWGMPSKSGWFLSGSKAGLASGRASNCVCVLELSLGGLGAGLVLPVILLFALLEAALS